MKVDAHHHFWKYSETEYGWIDDEMATIRRDFLADELKETLRSTGVDVAVSVQARQSIEETQWLLSLAESEDFLVGVVGWLPIASKDFPQILASYSGRRKLRGLRHVVQGESGGYLLGSGFNNGIALLKDCDLAYDILVFERQLEEVIHFVDRHPEQRFIVDHIAKPRIRENVMEPWRKWMHDLARRKNVWCKLSGVVTEADYKRWTPTSINPFIEEAFLAFGAKRMLFGSDWPVCLVACAYQRWHDIVSTFVGTLSIDEQKAFWRLNAEEAYHLTLPNI